MKKLITLLLIFAATIFTASAGTGDPTKDYQNKAAMLKKASGMPFMPQSVLIQKAGALKQQYSECSWVTWASLGVNTGTFTCKCYCNGPSGEWWDMVWSQGSNCGTPPARFTVINPDGESIRIDLRKQKLNFTEDVDFEKVPDIPLENTLRLVNTDNAPSVVNAYSECSWTHSTRGGVNGGINIARCYCNGPTGEWWDMVWSNGSNCGTPPSDYVVQNPPNDESIRVDLRKK